MSTALGMIHELGGVTLPRMSRSDGRDPPLRLLLRYLQAFLPPNALYPSVVHAPSNAVQEPRDLPVAVAPEVTRQLDDHCRHHVLILSALGDMPPH
jgi:hypothetical protein